MTALLPRALPWFTSFAVALTACGGRTEALDPTEVGLGSSQPSGGAASGGNSSVGSGAAPGKGPSTPVPSPLPGVPSPGQGGTSSGSAGGSATGGKPGSGGVTPTLVSRACTNYCNAANGSCPAALPPFTQCQAACVTELSAQSADCQRDAGAIIDCMGPILAADRQVCTGVWELAAAQCAATIAAYARCEGQSIDPLPGVPMPMPLPTRSCSSGATGTVNDCTATMKCSDGSSSFVKCTQVSATASRCVCSTGRGPGPLFDLNESVAIACQDSLSVCAPLL